jgi:hypothetical protein
MSSARLCSFDRSWKSSPWLSRRRSMITLAFPSFSFSEPTSCVSTFANPAEGRPASNRPTRSVAAIDLAAGRSIAVRTLARWRVAPRDRGPDRSRHHTRCARFAMLSGSWRGAAGVPQRSATPGEPAARDCVSGRELRDRGFPEDVEAAIQLNVSSTTPILVHGAYIPSRR